MRVISLVLSLLLITQPAMALGLSEMQQIALSKREIVKRFIVNLKKSEKDIGLARSGYYPSVDLSYELNALDQESTIEEQTNSTYLGAVTWNLFNGFKDKYEIESADLLMEVEEHQLAGLKQDIQLNVALRYLDVYERRANLEVTENNYTTLEKIYRDGENRLKVGLIDRNELLQFKVDLDNSELQVEAARAGLEKSFTLLSREIGEVLTMTELGFKEFDTIPENEDLDENMQLMLLSRSELQALRKLLDASVFQIKTEESGYYPKVDLVGSYRNFGDSSINTIGESTADDYELRAQLRLSLNLFQGYFTEESVAKARLENQGLHYDLKELTDTLKTELQNLHTDFEVSLRNVDVALVSIEQAEENLRITQLKYDEGLQRESELLDAVTNLSRARFNYVSVVRTVFLNYFRILRAIEGFDATTGQVR